MVMNMDIRELGEFGFIRRISQGCLIRPDDVIKGIGDDAAVFAVDGKEAVLVTTDLLVERVHFLRDGTSGSDLGYKAMAVNLSDIAAMGGTAREAFISVGIPEKMPVEYLDDLYNGMKELTGEFSVNILGGDTTVSRTDMIINITLIGSAPRDELLFRSGAREGDIIFVTGRLGDSRAGLHLIIHEPDTIQPDFETLVNAHRRPRPHLREGRFLARHGGVSAAMDVSDGLASDLRHITGSSGLGAILNASCIPVSEDLKVFCNQYGFEPSDFAIKGGEDYVLLCTVDPAAAEALTSEFMKAFSRPLYSIGVVTSSGKIEVKGEDGLTRGLQEVGWNHFGTQGNLTR
jgi:thiamine-monophosphate kinase